MDSGARAAKTDGLSSHGAIRALRRIFRTSSKVSDATGHQPRNGELDKISPNSASIANQSLRWLQNDSSLCNVCQSVTTQGLEVGFKHHLVKHFHDEFFVKQGPYAGPIEWEEYPLPISLIHQASQCRLCAMIWQAMSRNVSFVFEDLVHWKINTGEPKPESLNWVLQRQVYLFFKPAISDFGSPTVEVKIEGEREKNYFGRFALVRVVGLNASTHVQEHEWPIQLDPMAKSVWDWIEVRMHQCQFSHHQCSISYKWSLPSRLVYVGTEKDPTPRLRETTNWPSSGGLLSKKAMPKGYVALSYCWGTEPVFTTTPANLEQMKQAIPEHELPKTIRDAMTVARNLGFMYLWVDSLCILQGNSEVAKNDWREEATRMADIYSGAALTICAAAPTKAAEGFLHTRPTLDDVQPVKLPLIDDYVASLNRLDLVVQGERRTPIHTRAWTLQEYLLSTRMLIYGREEVIWKCQEHNERESGLETDAALILSDWKSIVMDYSARLLTVESDRLMAISGVAAAKFPDRGLYLSGAWVNTLLADLIWVESDYMGKVDKVANKLPNTEEGAPSWSWASHMAQVSFFSQPRGLDTTQVSVTKHLQLDRGCSRDGIHGPYSVLEVVARLARTNMAALLSFPTTSHHEWNPMYLSIRLDISRESHDTLDQSAKEKYLKSDVVFMPIYQDKGVILTPDFTHPIGLRHKYSGTDLRTLRQAPVDVRRMSQLPQLRRIGAYSVQHRPFEPDWSYLGTSLGSLETFLLV